MSLGNVDLTPQLVQAVRDAADIVSVATEHTRLQKAGRKQKGLCPIHKEKTPSFNVDPDKGLFYCFGCGAGGDAIRLHMLATGDDFPAAIESLARRYGIPLPRKSGGRRREDGPDLHSALEAADEFFRRELSRSAEAQRYLEDRRISAELIERFGLGYAPEGWRNLIEALDGKVPLRDLEAAGLSGRSERDDRPFDRFRQRLIFPIRSPTGRLLGFGGRTLGDDRAKYINTQETEQFHKGRLLYGLYEAKKALRESGVAVLTEGYFDVLAVVASGLEGAVASMGTALTGEQATLLARFCGEAVIAYDGDSAGNEAARRCLPILLRQGFKVRRASLGADQDPDSLRLESGEAAVSEAIAQAPDAVVQEMELLAPEGLRSDPQGQAAAASQIAELLQAMPDAIVRRGYSRLIADRLDLPEELLWRRSQQRKGRRQEAAAPANDPAPKADVPWTLESNILESLLRAPASAPALERLPEAEIFPDRVCRETYRAYLDLYRRGSVPPAADEVRRQLEPGGAEVALLARLDAAEAPPTLTFGPLELLRRLDRWWVDKESRRINAAIREAERQGDISRLQRLFSWKSEVSQLLHRRPPGGEWSFGKLRRPSEAESSLAEE
jgi:DNA primase